MKTENRIYLLKVDLGFWERLIALEIITSKWLIKIANIWLSLSSKLSTEATGEIEIDDYKIGLIWNLIL